ncbi:hypothetical protein AcV7_007308 [Taiwanofungus camphoratus]|nr:hypothetical protein AcW2_005524 [Antrodia cinnamomea]KAI0953913.1 hypothetical protein AcV7_007308 [Antrodia cinnamomea]
MDCLLLAVYLAGELLSYYAIIGPQTATSGPVKRDHRHFPFHLSILQHVPITDRHCLSEDNALIIEAASRVVR